MANTVSLQGPIGSSITLSYGSTGLPIVSATDPKYPTGGYSGRLDAASLQSGISSLQGNIDRNNTLIAQLRLQINSTQNNSTIPTSEKQLIIQDYQNTINSLTNKNNNFADSISIASYLLSNLSSLTAKLQAAQASPTPNPSVPNAPNQKPATIASNTTTTTTKVTSNSVTKTTVTNTTNTTANSKTTTTTVKSAKTTTDPSRVVLSTQDIVINPEPLSVPIIDIKTGKVTGNTTIKPSPIVIPGETVYANGVSVTTTGEVKPATGPIAPSAQPPVLGLSKGITTAAAGATAQDQANFTAKQDWRVRLSLAPGSNYLYNAPDNKGILAPLAKTDGVIFPYTPGISVNYAASYEQTALTHTNYKINQYQSSSIDSVQITCDFTAQDVFEANYLLAVIHFFRTMTKMFYGKDDNPIRGTPPPLCYLYGMGGFQFAALPLAITGFNYSLPQDVDYIKTTGASAAGTPQPTVPNGATNTTVTSDRLGPNLLPGGKGAKPNYGSTPTQDSEETTWVPTKIGLSITCLPIMSRNAVSNKFSLKDYATGALLNGTRSGATGGGFW